MQLLEIHIENFCGDRIEAMSGVATIYRYENKV